MKILIIVPAFNEEKNLPLVVEDLTKNCEIPKDIVVVDDASTDSTASVAKSLGLKVLRLPVNLGIGGAVQTGFKYAVSQGYDVAIQFDGDGQHQAAYIANLIDSFEKDRVDLVMGSRFIEKTDYQSPVARRVGMWLFSSVYGLLTGRRIYDTTSGFRLYGRELMKYFCRYYPTDFPDMPALLAASRRGFKISEVSVQMKHREHGVSSTGFWKSVWYPFKTISAAFAVYLEVGR